MSARLSSLGSTLVAAVLLSGCGAANTSGSTDKICRSVTTTAAVRPDAWKGSVFTIVMENKSYGDIIGNGAAPYINQLAKDNAVAAGYHDSYIHPSELIAPEWPCLAALRYKLRASL